MKCAFGASATHFWDLSSVDTPANVMTFLTFLTLTANKVSIHPLKRHL